MQSARERPTIGREARVGAVRILSFVVCAILGGAVSLAQPARADVYTWFDAAGRMNVGNVEPPEGARVKSVVRTTSRPKDAVSDSARQAEIAALARRVRELEEEADAARQQSTALPPAPPVVYQIVQASPPPVASAQAIVSYGGASYPPQNYGCDPSWVGCGLWWGPAFVTNSFIGRPGRFHHNGSNRGGFASRPPMHSPGFRATWR
jgi:uncharacterized membrane protein